MNFDVKNMDLATAGRYKIEWAEQEMPVLKQIRDRFQEGTAAQRHQGVCMFACDQRNSRADAHAAGRRRRYRDLCASNPLSTQDEVAASLVANDEIPTYAIKGEDNATYYKHLNAALDHHPQMTMDDGCDLVSILHKQRASQVPEIIGGTEETTTGVIRLRAMANDGALRFPVIAVNDSMTKHYFDNRYGTGQSTLDGIIRATNVLLAGKTLGCQWLRLVRPWRGSHARAAWARRLL